MSQAHRADIQGLRAVAVLSVLINHVRRDLLPGGFVGVDIFFVISGFLITSTLLRDAAEGHYSITQFYVRRLRRLFPALMVVLAATSIGAWWLLAPADLAEYGRTLAAAALFLSNVEFADLGGYFGGDARLKPLLHTWSLAVEEQFYLLFPLILWLMSRAPRKGVQIGVAVLTFASLAASVAMTANDAERAYFATPARAFEPLIGAFLAVRPLPTLSARQRDILSLGGLTLIVLSFGLINHNTPFPGAAALAPVLGTAAMLAAGAAAPSRAGRWLSGGAMNFIGDMSYSLYLWHWPLLALARYAGDGRLTLPAAFAAVAGSFALATLSRRYVEAPFLRSRGRGRSVLALAALAIGVCVAAGAVFYVLKGLPARFPPAAQQLFAGAGDANPRREECHNDSRQFRGFAAACRFGATNATATWAVWGDSHGAEFVVALGERLAHEGAATIELTTSACPPALGFTSSDRPRCRVINDDAYTHLIADRSIATVVLAARYDSYDGERWSAVSRGMAAAVSGLRGAGKRVIVIGALPIMEGDPPSALGKLSARGVSPDQYGVARGDFERMRADARVLLADLAARGAEVIEPSQFLCDDVFCHAYDAATARSFYFNQTHLSLVGARRLAAQLALH